MTATPRCRSASARVARAAAPPEATIRSGAFTAATARSSRPSGHAAWTVSRSAPIETIPPRSGSASISWARAATSRAASSREQAPAATAAANSPMLWPMTTAGTTPHEAQSSVSAICSEKSAGWAYSVRFRRASSSSKSASATGMPSAANEARHRWSAVRNTGSSPARSSPIRAYCAPCPENMNTIGSRRPLPFAPPAPRAPRGNRSSSARSSSRSRPTAENRWAKWRRPRFAVKHRSRSVSASARATALRRLSTWAPSASMV